MPDMEVMTMDSFQVSEKTELSVLKNLFFSLDDISAYPEIFSV